MPNLTDDHHQLGAKERIKEKRRRGYRGSTINQSRKPLKCVSSLHPLYLYPP